jgi:Ca-activated chloride channel family protein
MTDTLPLSLRTDVPLVPAGSPATRYVLLSLSAPEGRSDRSRPAIRVSFVLDRSGSMAGSKIHVAREAVRQALRMLRPDDRFALVAYDDEVELVARAAPATGAARRGALERLEAIDARGSTDLSGGWMTGCDQVLPHLADEPPGRCLLLTDGLANVGVTDPDALAARAAELRKRHVVTSTFGVGTDFDEVLLQRIAERGGGHFYFVESPVQIPDLLTSELGEALEVVARDASVALQLPAGVSAAPLSRLEWFATDGGIRIILGDLVSGQDLDVVLRVEVPAMAAGSVVPVRFTLGDREGVLALAPVEACWTAAEAGAVAAAGRERAVDRAVAVLYAARARHDALALNRAGEFGRARALLLAVAGRIEGYAGDDEALRATAAQLRREAAEFGEEMDACSQKARHMASYAAMSNRAPDGKARRRVPGRPA